jgi:anti-anti-sigma factor
MPLICDDESATVALKGQVKTREGADLKAAVGRFLEHGAETVTLDMASAALIDSTVLGQMLLAHLECKKRGATMRIIHIGEEVRSIFEVTHLDSLLNLED